ncbi:MAG TPA: hypothetical protein VFF28_03470 [Candidatus Nanoarchaeia archaeon]|nr:hypothetical protein [Candidatus Nanoarchaeia archaeon]
MNSIYRTIRNALLASSLALGTYTMPAKADSQAKLNNNTLETAVVVNGGKSPVRNRLLTDFLF